MNVHVHEANQTGDKCCHHDPNALMGEVTIPGCTPVPLKVIVLNKLLEEQPV